MDKQHDKYWELIVSVLSDEADAKERQELQEWLDRDPAHRYLFEKVSRLFQATKKSSLPPDFDQEKGWTSFVQYLRKRRLRRLSIAFSGVAAILIIAVAVSFLQLNKPVSEQSIGPGSAKAILIVGDQAPIAIDHHTLALSGEGAEISNDSIDGLVFRNKAESEEKITYSTVVIPRGGEYKITLPDGTQVWLNAESELRFPSHFTGDSRIVEFKGEGYFEVTPDPHRPFRVHTKDAEIKVYGTQFNLHAYEEENRLAATLVSGSVSVTPAGGQEVKIKPSQQLSYSRATQQISVKEVDTDLYTSWKDGLYSFENASLEEIFDYLKRWYMFEVSYTDDNLRGMRFTGTFQKDRPIGYGLNLIRLTCEVNFTVQGNRITVHP